jgi:UDP:flavonoid glycosyltransferase YjiC (YdhE family)
MKIVATSFGSSGDLLPTLSIAAALAAAGHEVLFVGNPSSEAQARAAGLRFVPAGEPIDIFRRMEENPIYLDALRGPDALWNDFAIPYNTATYAVLRDLLRREPVDAVVSSNVCPAGVWAAFEHRLPNVMVAATPLSWLHAGAPTQFLDFALPARALPWIAHAARWTVSRLLDRKLLALARRLGVRLDDPRISWAERHVDLHLGTWSPRIRPVLPSDPSNCVVCGFAQAGHLGHGPTTLDPEIDAYLEGGRTVVVGLGSIFSLMADEDLSHAAEACAELGLRCLVVGHPSKGTRFPAGTRTAKYVPHHLVFPKACAVATHGGAGSTSEALRSGRPIIVAPFGYDQFAMAFEVERLGVGVRVRKKKRGRAAWRDAIARATSDGDIAARARASGEAFRAERDGADLAAERIARLCATR